MVLSRLSHAPSRLVFAFAALSVILIVVGVTVYEFVADSIRKRENEQLGAIAEFKKDQLAAWLAERRGDILVYMDSPFFADALAKLKAGPDGNAHRQLVSRLESTRKAHGYIGTEILDPNGRVVASAGEAGRHDAQFEVTARRALEQPRPILLDLHRPVLSDPIRMAYVAAVRDARSPGTPVVGLVVFTIDPERTLYPMLGSWPTASTSGETFIVRRDGDDVLFLSILRHRNATPLSLQFPLSRGEIPAVQAVTLGNGVYEGTDYRGASVLSAARAVPGTPWLLLSKVDQREVFADVRATAWICGAVILFGIAIIGVFFAMAWRQQRLSDQAQLDLHLRGIVSTIPGALFSFRLQSDGGFDVPYISEGAGDLFGIDAEELRTDGSLFLGLMVAGERERFERSLAGSAPALLGTWRCEWRIRHPVAGERWIEGNALPQRQASGDVLWHGHLQDVTERKAVEVVLRERLELRDQFAKVAASVPGLVYSFRLRPDGRTSIPYASPAIVELFGRSPAEIAEDAEPIFAVMAPGDAERVRASVLESARTLAPWRNEWRIRCPDKTERWIEGHSVPKREPDGGVLWHGYLHDVTERKLAEISLDRANRMLRARSLSNLALVRADDERSYLREVCEIIVGACGHTMMWIGHADRGAGQRVVPMAVAGLDCGYLEGAVITWGDDEHGQGPTGTAIRTGQAVLCREMLTDPRLQPWCDEATWRGYRSSVALPLTVKNEVVGALTIYSAEPDAFPDDDVRLLGELADDVASGISVLRLRAAHAQIELSLKDSEEKLRLFIEHAPVALAMFDADMRHLFASRRWLAANRLDATDIVGRSYFEVCPDLPDRWKEVFRRCLAGAVEKCDEDAVTWPDGRIDWRRWEVRPWYKGTDTVGGIVVMSEDITTAKRTQEALERYRVHLEDMVTERTRLLEETVRLTHERAAEIADLYDNAPCGYHSLDPTGLIVRINETELSWLGYGRDEVVGKMLFPDLLDEQGKACFRDNFARFLSQGHLPDHEYELRAKDGRRIPVLLTKSSVRDRSGAVVMSRSVVYNLTERKRSEETLRESEAKYRVLFDRSPDGILLIDPDTTRPIEFNASAHQVLGYSRDEFANLRLSDISAAASPEMVQDRVGAVLRSGGDDFETLQRTRDGALRNLSVSVRTLELQGRAVHHAIWRDITERKQAEAELARYRDGLEVLVAERTAALSESNRELVVARDKAEAANHAKSTFLANMSHELRTPLTAILGFSQLLELDREGSDPDEDRLCVDHILENGKHLLTLVNDLLDLAKIDAGYISTSPERVGVADLLSSLEAALRPLAEATGIAVSVLAQDGLPDVRADRTRLNQVLLNLCTNAVKYNHPGGRVEVTCERPGPEWVRVVVTDTGLGIAEARHGEVFEAFNRLGRETGSIEGTGVGLALSRRLMDLMGGKIDFSSRTGEGSRFWIDIPVYVPAVGGDGAARDEMVPHPAGEADDRTVCGSWTVLCVDDNVAARELVSKIIVGIPGTRVLTAETAEVGIEMARRDPPDLILMDINLPGMDGIEALGELRRHRATRDIPVFALSAAATAADVDKGITAGFERYLTKPYDVHDLLRAVADELAARPDDTGGRSSNERIGTTVPERETAA